MQFTTVMLIIGSILSFIYGIIIPLFSTQGYSDNIFLLIPMPLIITTILFSVCIAARYFILFISTSSLVYSICSILLPIFSYIYGANIGYDSAGYVIQSQTGIDPNDLGTILNQMTKVSSIKYFIQ